MGVDFYTCANCAYNYPDCGDYFRCSGCEEGFCSDKCGGRQIIEEESDEEVDDEHYKEELTSCILCRKESVTDNTLLHFLLNKFNLTYEQALELYKKEPEDLEE